MVFFFGQDGSTLSTFFMFDVFINLYLLQLEGTRF
jgi:hypothetical protein